MSTTFAAGIDNNPIYATRAEQDRNGDQIDLTYAKKSEIPSELHAASGLVIESDVIGAKVDGSTITVNLDGELEVIGGGGSSYTAGGGIDISNDIISAKVDGNTITVNSSGELVAGGSSTSLNVGSPLKISNDYDTIDLCQDPRYFTYLQYGVNTPITCTSQGTYFSYIYHPWSYSRQYRGKNLILLYSYGANSSSTNRIPFWFPISVNNTSASTAPRLRVLSNGFTSDYSGYTIYRDNGTTTTIPYSGNDTFTLSIPVPPGVGPDFNFDTNLFAVEGDWSSVTTPVDAWYLGIAVSTDGTSWYYGDGFTNNKNTSNRAIRNGDNGLTLKLSDSSLSVNGAGMKVTYPLPSSTSSDEGKILTVDSSGNPYWATLSDLGIVTNS